MPLINMTSAEDNLKYCDLCDNLVEDAIKYPDQVWACEDCNKQYPMIEDDEDTSPNVIYYHDTGDENDNVDED